MNKNMRKALFVCTAAILIASCGGEKPQTQQPLPSPLPEVYSPPSQGKATDRPVSGNGVGENPVGTTTMGKIVAARFADLSFELSLPIERVLVRNGQQVRRGQTLAVLDQFRLRNAIEQQQRAIEQAQLQIEQAHLQMQDVIISQGYDPDKTASIPDDVKHNADVKSGYALAKSQLAIARTQLASAQHELRSGVLTAPFDGVVANLSVQAHQLSQPGQVVCRIIDTNDMEVEFRVMESDLCKYSIGTEVAVIPVADKNTQYEATVNVINPVVDEQGAVALRARLDNAAALFDGMNVEVTLRLKMDN